MGDKEVVLAAVRQSGNALYDSDELKGDKEVVLFSASKWHAFYASDELKGDKVFWLFN